MSYEVSDRKRIFVKNENVCIVGYGAIGPIHAAAVAKTKMQACMPYAILTAQNRFMQK